jgi:predicted RNA-binding Zn-ribbon protein involved in translation (DUF1610 family)
MVFEYARFVIYYKNGKTVIENREDPHHWDNAPKYEYLCPSCWSKYPYYPQAEMFYCPECLKNDKEVAVIRQNIIRGLGIQFDPMPLYDPEKDAPMLTEKGEAIRVTSNASVLKGSSAFNYGFFQDKPGDQKMGISLKTGKIFDLGKPTHGIRIGMVVDPQGHCICMTGFMTKGAPRVYTYRTTVRSLDFKEALFDLHQIKLPECGNRTIYKDPRDAHKHTKLSLGERAEI